MKFSKLVRDRIPSIIITNGSLPITHVADDEEYWEKLKEKLQEEVLEYNDSNENEELADILEVINAICEFRGIDIQHIENLREKKASKSGSFKHKLILDSVEEARN